MNNSRTDLVLIVLVAMSLGFNVFLYSKVSSIEAYIDQNPGTVGVPGLIPSHPVVANPPVSLTVATSVGGQVTGVAQYQISGGNFSKSITLVFDSKTVIDQGSLAGVRAGDNISALTEESVVDTSTLHALHAVINPHPPVLAASTTPIYK